MHHQHERETKRPFSPIRSMHSLAGLFPFTHCFRIIAFYVVPKISLHFLVSVVIVFNNPVWTIRGDSSSARLTNLAPPEIRLFRVSNRKAVGFIEVRSCVYVIKNSVVVCLYSQNFILSPKRERRYSAYQCNMWKVPFPSYYFI